jgi:hypothetical protein
VRLATGDGRTPAQAVAEAVLFVAATALITWIAERRLLREVAAQARTGGLRAAAAG